MEKIVKIVMAVIAVLTIVWGVAQAENIKLSRGLNLPDDVKITPPSTALPPQLAMLSGVWQGDWEGRLDAALVVESINENGGTVVYSWGDYDPWNVRAGYRRFEFNIKENFIIFSTPTGRTVFTVKLLDQNTIIIMREATDSTKETKLKRKQ